LRAHFSEKITQKEPVMSSLVVLIKKYVKRNDIHLFSFFFLLAHFFTIGINSTKEYRKYMFEVCAQEELKRAKSDRLKEDKN
jgi:hypothetical protein